MSAKRGQGSRVRVRAPIVCVGNEWACMCMKKCSCIWSVYLGRLSDPSVSHRSGRHGSWGPARLCRLAGRTGPACRRPGSWPTPDAPAAEASARSSASASCPLTHTHPSVGGHNNTTSKQSSCCCHCHYKFACRNAVFCKEYNLTMLCLYIPKYPNLTFTFSNH